MHEAKVNNLQQGITQPNRNRLCGVQNEAKPMQYTEDCSSGKLSFMAL